MKRLLVLAVAGAAMAATADVTLTIDKAQQRWPWNNVVDVDFTLGGAAADEQFVIELSASSALEGKTYAAKTYVSEPVAKAGSCRVSWDFGACA